MSKRLCARVSVLLTILCASGFAWAQSVADNSGPYNLTILEGGEGLTRNLPPGTASLQANGPWSMSGWVKPQRHFGKSTVLFGVGNSPERARALLLSGGKFVLFVDGRGIESGSDVPAGTWTSLAATRWP